jgi:hypothetical protein
VTLVDASVSKGIEKVTETGIVAGGQEFECDVIIWAVGFDILGLNLDGHKFLNVLGKEGLTKQQKWDRDGGMSTYLGVLASGFPNLFFFGNGGLKRLGRTFRRLAHFFRISPSPVLAQLPFDLRVHGAVLDVHHFRVPQARDQDGGADEGSGGGVDQGNHGIEPREHRVQGHVQ